MVSNASVTLASSVTSMVTTWMRSACSGNAPLRDSSASRRRPLTMTVAPASSRHRVKLWPRPPAAPVTSAVLPSTRRGRFVLPGFVLLELFIFRPPEHKNRTSARIIQALDRTRTRKPKIPRGFELRPNPDREHTHCVHKLCKVYADNQCPGNPGKTLKSSFVSGEVLEEIFLDAQSNAVMRGKSETSGSTLLGF